MNSNKNLCQWEVPVCHVSNDKREADGKRIHYMCTYDGVSAAVVTKAKQNEAPRTDVERSPGPTLCECVSRGSA